MKCGSVPANTRVGVCFPPLTTGFVRYSTVFLVIVTYKGKRVLNMSNTTVETDHPQFQFGDHPRFSLISMREEFAHCSFALLKCDAFK